MDFQRNQSWKEGKNEKTGNRTYRVMGTEQALLTIRRNRGTNGSPGIPEFHHKRRGRLRRKGGDFWEEKLSIKFFVKEEKTEGNFITLFPGILWKPLLHILGLKKNQTLQVLKVEIAIQDCNFWACLNLVSRLSEHTVTITKQILMKYVSLI